MLLIPTDVDSEEENLIKQEKTRDRCSKEKFFLTVFFLGFLSFFIIFLVDHFNLSPTTTTTKDKGITIYSNDNRYQSFVIGANERFVGTPLYIHSCESVNCVVTAMEDALSKGLHVTVKNGGNCLEDFVVNNANGVIIDISLLKGTYWDNDMNSYCIMSGNTLKETLTSLYKKYNVIVPGSSYSGVGMGGFVSGGGIGYLTRTYGLSIDYLTAIEIITVDSRGQPHITVTRKNDKNSKLRDLFWALCGSGSGNYGIITKFWFSKDLPKLPYLIYEGYFTYSWSDLALENQFSNLLTNFGNFFQSQNDLFEGYQDLYSQINLFPSSISSSISISFLYFGTDTAIIDSFITEINNGLTISPTQFIINKRTTKQFYQDYDNFNNYPPSNTNNDNFLNNRDLPRFKKKTAFMKKSFPSDQISTLYKWLHVKPINKSDSSPFRTSIQVRALGGALRAISNSETAFAHRDAILEVQYNAEWHNVSLDNDYINWINSFYQTMYQNTNGEPISNDIMDGADVNYVDKDLRNWATLYYKENYDKLVEINRNWDPLETFTYSQGIGEH